MVGASEAAGSSSCPAPAAEPVLGVTAPGMGAMPQGLMATSGCGPLTSLSGGRN